MKQQIRYFSIGLLTASLIMLIVVSFFDEKNINTNDSSVDEMTEALKNEGYHVLSSDDYISLTVNDSNEDKEDTDTEKDQDAKEDTESKDDKDEQEDTQTDEEEVSTYTLTVEPNMLSPTISKLLEENKIIDNADDFNRYLETEGHAPYIQLGDHELSSDMSNSEIAKKIAR